MDIQIHSFIQNLSGVEAFWASDITAEEMVDRKVTIPHRHDHYCVFFLEKGHLTFNVDFQSVDLEASSLLISCPGQVHQFVSASEMDGWVLAFDAGLVDQHARRVIEQSFAKVALLQLDPYDKEWFMNIFKLIHSNLNEKKPAGFNHQITQTLLNAFFYKTAATFQVQEDQRIQVYSSRIVEIAKTFHQLVKEHFLTLKRPADYASKMHMTVSYLNDTVKSVTGFPSTYFIQHEILREAQRLLFYTDKSVKEIAFQLGYEDYKYFIRLFSKTIGTSPASFRKANYSLPPTKSKSALEIETLSF